MPTGYTAAIKDGISFERFTWNCARSFGALITMRDEPSGAPIHEEFKVSDFYASELAKAEDRLAVLQAMSDEESCAAAAAAHTEAVARVEKLLAEAQDLRSKYEAMLDKVTAWTPPTPDHLGLKDFMVDQLRKSIDFDCSTEYITQPVLKDGAAWRADAIARAGRLIKHYVEMHAEEVTRTAERNAWIRALRESVPPPAA